MDAYSVLDEFAEELVTSIRFDHQPASQANPILLGQNLAQLAALEQSRTAGGRFTVPAALRRSMLTHDRRSGVRR